MIYDCPACGNALIFDPETGKMKCNSCENSYETFELHDRKTRSRSSESGDLHSTDSLHGQDLNPDPQTPDSAKTSGSSLYLDDTMECSVYTCTACGAQIAVNDVEVSTFCAYCGQPTVVFDRIASTKKPKYIIPFSITKNQAVEMIRSRLLKGDFVPEEIKHFPVERVRGIYVPFWLYDLYYRDRQYIRGKRDKKDYYFYRDAECEFQKLTLDASFQLNNESSQRLEPYHMEDLKEFTPEYLSGFYADRYDIQTIQLNRLAVSRAGMLFDEEIKKTIRAGSLLVLHQEPEYEIKGTESAMFPVWFLTLRYEGLPYTMLVNGQTGKIVGAVPFVKKKAAALFLVLGIPLSVLLTFLFSILLDEPTNEYGFRLTGMLIMAGVIFLACGIDYLKKIRVSTELTGLTATNRFVKERQEE